MAAPKKQPKKKEDNPVSEVVEPQTWLEKASGLLGTLLKDASDARVASIKLANMDYAQELSSQLLEHAQNMEGLYKEISVAVSKGLDEKSVKELVQKAQNLQAFGAKAQAHRLPEILVL